jgi:hypothetical protein
MTAYTTEKTGSISIENGSTALTGDSTLFSVRACAGGLLLVGGGIGVIATVESDTAATLEQAWPGSTASDVPYIIVRSTASAARLVNAQDKIADLVDKLDGQFFFNYDAFGTALSDRDAFDDEAAGFRFALLSGGAPVLYVRTTAVAGTWTDGVTLKGEQGEQGPQGESGVAFDFSGSGAPSSGLGVNGQTYLDVDNGDTYVKASGTWGTPTGSLKGDTGNKGWSAEPSLVTDGNRTVIRIADYIGGEGTKPSGAGLYIGVGGLVANINDAIDVRGSTGAQGPRGVQFEGAWNSATVYQPGDIVIDDDGASNPATWIAVAANTNSKPRDNPSDWAYFPGSFPETVNDGLWSDTITQSTNDGVWGV